MYHTQAVVGVYTWPFLENKSIDLSDLANCATVLHKQKAATPLSPACSVLTLAMSPKEVILISSILCDQIISN